MRIGIYRELSGKGPCALGGAEFVMAVLAEAFENDHDVEILGDNPVFRPDQIAETFDIHLTRTRFRPYDPGTRPAPVRTPWGLYRHAAEWMADASRGYDHFLCITHGIPPFCYVRSGLLLILFPYPDDSELWPWHESLTGWIDQFWHAPRNGLYSWIWKRRFRSYRHIVLISEFTRHWTRRWWNVDGQVVYPPVDIQARPATKQPIILNVGRFTPRKKQLELINAFRASFHGQDDGWELQCLGNLGHAAEDQDYFSQLEQATARQPIRLVANASRSKLRQVLDQASIFWHAMGYGEDAAPYRMEHFGIVTVEAMAAGCVPVVINRGGQPEIVRHGIDGFLWDTLDELADYTNRLVHDDVLRNRMAAAARARALGFSKEKFIDSISPYLIGGSSDSLRRGLAGGQTAARPEPSTIVDAGAPLNP